MEDYPSNQERTKLALQKFDRGAVLHSLISAENPLIFDVGANQGQSVDYFKKLFPQCKIHCFEPDPQSFSRLKENVDYPDVILNNLAASNKIGKVPFYQQNVSSGLNGFHKVNLASRDSISLQEVKSKGRKEQIEYSNDFNSKIIVEACTLEKYFIEHQLNHIHILKIDTQGHEPEVLQGFGSCLDKVDVVLLELMFYDYYERSVSFYDVEQFLRPFGFHLYDLSHIAKNPMNGRTDWVDAIYIVNRTE